MEIKCSSCPKIFWTGTKAEYEALGNSYDENNKPEWMRRASDHDLSDKGEHEVVVKDEDGKESEFFYYGITQ